MRKPVYSICEQQKCKSACASTVQDGLSLTWLKTPKTGFFSVKAHNKGSTNPYPRQIHQICNSNYKSANLMENNTSQNISTKLNCVKTKPKGQTMQPPLWAYESIIFAATEVHIYSFVDHNIILPWSISFYFFFLFFLHVETVAVINFLYFIFFFSFKKIIFWHEANHERSMSRDMTKPMKWVCAQRRLRSAWASAQSDQSLPCPHEETLGP